MKINRLRPSKKTDLRHIIYNRVRDLFQIQILFKISVVIQIPLAENDQNILIDKGGKPTTISKTGLIPLTRRTTRTEPTLDEMGLKSIINEAVLPLLPLPRVDRDKSVCMFDTFSAGMGMKDKQPDEESPMRVVLDGFDESNPSVLTSESSKTDAIGFSLVEASCASQR